MQILFNNCRSGLRLGLIVLVLPFLTVSHGLAQGLIWSGYADFEATVADPSGDGAMKFDNHHFNLIGLGSLTGDLFAAAEVEYEHSGEEIALEYGYIGYTGFSNFRIMAGKFIVPFGRFNKDLHPTWINKLVDRPHGFKNILPQTYSDAGIWVSGAQPMSGGNRVVFDAYIVNGLKGDDGGDLRKMRDADRPTTRKAFGARLGIETGASGFDAGVSVYNSQYTEDLNLMLIGVDAAFRRNALEIRAEAISATQEVSTGDDLTKRGGYAQIAYRLESNIEPVVRFSARDFDDDKDDLSRMSVGFSYYVSASSAVRLNYHLNTEKDDFKKDNDALSLQFTVSF